MPKVMTSAPFFTVLLVGASIVGPASAGAAPAPGPGGATNPTSRNDRQILAEAPALRPRVLELTRRAHRRARQRGLTDRARMAVIDYGLPSTTPRLFVLDLSSNRVERIELVAHGRATGGQYARYFSNVPGSRASSVGLYRTLGTYRGQHGYSLRLEGLEPGFNDRARARSIVMHGAWYVSEEFGQRYGRLGRSWGCPAVSKAVARSVIDHLKNGVLLLAYYPDDEWLEKSSFVRNERSISSQP